MTYLSLEERQRFDRQLRLVTCGEAGQLNLKASKIIVIGAGGLGCAVLTSLVMSGVGHIIIYDFDRVSRSNLHRQSLYREQDIGEYKVEIAQKRLQELNPFCKINIHSEPLRRYNALEHFKDCDLIVDCTDRFDVRGSIAELAHDFKIPHLYASVSGRDGQVALFLPKKACFRCLFDKLPGGGVIQNCDQGGVIGVTPQMVGAIQAQVAIDYILVPPDQSQPTTLQLVSTQPFRCHQMTIMPSANCPLCTVESNRNMNLEPSQGYSEPFPIPISSYDVQQRLKLGWTPIIIDVRSTEEVMTLGTISGSIHLESQNLIEQIETLLKNQNKNNKKPTVDLTTIMQREQAVIRDILVFCQRGPRAEKVASLLQCWHQKQILEWRDGQTSSFPETYELIGGFSGWST